MNETITDFYGHKQINFTINGRNSFIVSPEKPLDGNHWVWRTEFFGAFDYADRALLERGWYLAYHSVSDMYGCPESITMMREFYDVAVNEYKLNPRPALFGFSRGGLYASNFALRYPALVGLLYLDAPVMDIRSWPGGKGSGCGEKECWEECKGWYHLTEETAKDFKGNPLDNSEKLAATGIPIMLVCGAVDTVVPYSENGKLFYDRVKAAGGTIEQIIKPDCDHHPHSLSDPTPIVEFIEEKMLKNTLPTFQKIKMNVIGDSITYGAYTGASDDCPASVAEKQYCFVASDLLGFKSIENYGVSGTSISCTSSVLPERALSIRYKEMTDDANLILVAGGTNDFGTNVKIGSPSDIEDVSFYGGLNVFCKGLKQKYPSAKIVFITPIYRNDEAKNENGNSLDEYRKIIKETAKEKFGFEVIDGDKAGFAEKADIILSDGVHPTPIGHKMLGNFVAKQLADILSSGK